MDWKKEIKETILYIFVGLILAYVINTGLGYALDTTKPVMAVVSNSMEPTFSRGDLVVIKGAAHDDIWVGDVIVYDNPCRGIPVVHRVIDIKEAPVPESYRCPNGVVLSSENGIPVVFYTKGDNMRTNHLSDQASGIAPPIKPNWVRGRVILIIPKLGWLRVLLTELVL
ncbi:MAG: signal peptidase I [Candidatus Hydrothermarchaeales archaeon]